MWRILHDLDSLEVRDMQLNLSDIAAGWQRLLYCVGSDFGVLLSPNRELDAMNLGAANPLDEGP